MERRPITYPGAMDRIAPADVTDPPAVDQLFDHAEHDWGPVDVLIASAGAGYSARIERTSDADWYRMLELNLTAPFRCLRRAIPAMRAAGYGRIVVIASTASRRPEGVNATPRYGV